MNSRKFMLACLTGAGLISGCSDIRRTMGIENKPSDEFAISPQQKTLEIPPHFDLLPPVPGKATQGPFESEVGSQTGGAFASQKPLTASEKDLMAQLGPGLDLPGRAEMDSDTAAGVEKSKGFLGMGKSKSAKKDILDPQKEKERLETQQ